MTRLGGFELVYNDGPYLSWERRWLQRQAWYFYCDRPHRHAGVMYGPSYRGRDASAMALADAVRHVEEHHPELVAPSPVSEGDGRAER